MEERIRRKLEAALSPARVRVENQSHLHAGHAGDDGSGQTHFRVMIESDDLAAHSRVDAQRRVYACLAEELENGIHALSICIEKEK